VYSQICLLLKKRLAEVEGVDVVDVVWRLIVFSKGAESAWLCVSAARSNRVTTGVVTERVYARGSFVQD